MLTTCLKYDFCRLPVSLCNSKCKEKEMPTAKREKKGLIFKEKKLGMYRETPRVQIGKYSICKQSEGQIWIEHVSGEGGAFPEEMLEKHLQKFYDEFL